MNVLEQADQLMKTATFFPNMSYSSSSSSSSSKPSKPAAPKMPDVARGVGGFAFTEKERKDALAKRKAMEEAYQQHQDRLSSGTPNLDSMASQGSRFTSAWPTSVSGSATRSGLAANRGMMSQRPAPAARKGPPKPPEPLMHPRSDEWSTDVTFDARTADGKPTFINERDLMNILYRNPYLAAHVPGRGHKTAITLPDGRTVPITGQGMYNANTNTHGASYMLGMHRPEHVQHWIDPDNWEGDDGKLLHPTEVTRRLAGQVTAREAGKDAQRERESINSIMGGKGLFNRVVGNVKQDASGNDVMNVSSAGAPGPTFGQYAGAVGDTLYGAAGALPAVLADKASGGDGYSKAMARNLLAGPNMIMGTDIGHNVEARPAAADQNVANKDWTGSQFSISGANAQRDPVTGKMMRFDPASRQWIYDGATSQVQGAKDHHAMKRVDPDATELERAAAGLMRPTLGAGDTAARWGTYGKTMSKVPGLGWLDPAKMPPLGSLTTRGGAALDLGYETSDTINDYATMLEHMDEARYGQATQQLPADQQGPTRPPTQSLLTPAAVPKPAPKPPSKGKRYSLGAYGQPDRIFQGSTEITPPKAEPFDINQFDIPMQKQNAAPPAFDINTFDAPQVAKPATPVDNPVVPEIGAPAAGPSASFEAGQAAAPKPKLPPSQNPGDPGYANTGGFAQSIRDIMAPATATVRPKTPPAPTPEWDTLTPEQRQSWIDTGVKPGAQPGQPAPQQPAPQASQGQQAQQPAAQQPAATPQGVQPEVLQAVNSNQVPPEKAGDALATVVAQDTDAKAQRIAAETGEPVEQVKGRIGQQRLSGQLDEEDTATGLQNAERRIVKEHIEGATGEPATEEAIAQGVEQARKEPGWMEQIGMFWNNLENDEKIGLVVGIIGGIVSLVNGVSGGDTAMTLISGALGAGGIAYALGGGDWLKKQFGGKEEADTPAAPDADAPAAPEGPAQPPADPFAGVSQQAGGLDPEAEAAAGDWDINNFDAPQPAPTTQAAAPAWSDAMQQQVDSAVKNDGMIDSDEIGAFMQDNPHAASGAYDARLAQYYDQLDPKIKFNVEFFDKFPHLLEDEGWQKQITAAGATPEDIVRLIKIRDLSRQAPANA